MKLKDLIKKGKSLLGLQEQEIPVHKPAPVAVPTKRKITGSNLGDGLRMVPGWDGLLPMAPAPALTHIEPFYDKKRLCARKQQRRARGKAMSYRKAIARYLRKGGDPNAQFTEMARLGAR